MAAFEVITDNVATGRGKLTQGLEGAATELNSIFFAPRYVVSRFQVIAGQPFYGGNARTRILIATEYAKYLIGLNIVYGLAAAAGAEFEWDPRSSDFGKIRFGNTRIDPLSGMAQVSTLLGRLWHGETKTLSGQVEKAEHGTVLIRFLRQKLAPFPGGVWSAWTGKNAIGEEVTPGEVGIDMLTPISFGEIAEIMENEGVAKGSVYAMLSILGAGVQHYEAKRTRRERPMRKQRETRQLR